MVNSLRNVQRVYTRDVIRCTRTVWFLKQTVLSISKNAEFDGTFKMIENYKEFKATMT